MAGAIWNLTTPNKVRSPLYKRSFACAHNDYYSMYKGYKGYSQGGIQFQDLNRPTYNHGTIPYGPLAARFRTN